MIKNNTLIESVSGNQRVVLYQFARATGIRKNEISTLAVRDIVFGEESWVRLASVITKNSRYDEIPLDESILDDANIVNVMREFLVITEYASDKSELDLRDAIDGSGYRSGSRSWRSQRVHWSNMQLEQAVPVVFDESGAGAPFLAAAGDSRPSGHLLDAPALILEQVIGAHPYLCRRRCCGTGTGGFR